jgi:hypothetical protein
MTVHGPSRRCPSVFNRSNGKHLFFAKQPETPMRLPRFTTRRMMFLVAVVGVAFAGIAALGRQWQGAQHGELRTAQ